MEYIGMHVWGTVAVYLPSYIQDVMGMKNPAWFLSGFGLWFKLVIVTRGGKRKIGGDSLSQPKIAYSVQVGRAESSI